MPKQQRDNLVTVVGGGLAGMVAALEAVRMGFDVRLIEATRRLGGKAGSEPAPDLYDAHCRLNPDLALPEGVASDHGYHVFPAWYRNMRRLWERIGLDLARDVSPGYIYYDLPPARQSVRQPFRPKAPPTLRQLVAICELILQTDEAVDGLTLQAFLHARDYHQPRDPITLDDFILNALTIGDRDVSALVIRNVFRQWLPVFGQSNWDALRGSLAEVLIDPLERQIRAEARAAGVSFDLRYGQRVVAMTPRESPGLELHLQPSGRRRQSFHARRLILALPPEVLRTLDSGELFRRRAGLSKLHYLRSNPFSAIDIFCNRRLTPMEWEHFTLQGSGFRITGYDIAQHWPRLQRQGRTVLQFVAADSRGFSGLDDAAFTECMAAEIQRYFPDLVGGVDFYVPHRNLDAPLFVNDVGIWRHRPTTREGLPGVYFAGDHVLNETDVTSMEGAVRTGLMAAEALRVDWAPEQRPVEILEPVRAPELEELIELWPRDPLTARLRCLEWLRTRLPAPR